MNNLLKQSNHSPLIGALKEVAGHTMFWVSIINFALISATAYNTTIFPIISGVAPWFSFWLFMGLLVFVTLLAMLLEYKFVIPSVLAFRIKQEYKHQSPYRQDLENIQKKLAVISKKLGIEDEDSGG